MKTVAEIREKRAALLAQAGEILAEAQRDTDKPWTDEQETEYVKITSEADKLEKLASRLEKQQQAETELRQREERAKNPNAAGREQPSEWRDLGEFLHAIRFNRSDPRLVGAETRELDTSSFLLPIQYRLDILKVDPQAAVVRPRATIIPAGDPPDGRIEMPSLDQTGAKGLYGGVTVDWIAEGDTKPETTPAFKDVDLTPHEVAGHVIVTDKFLRNQAAAGELTRQLLRGAIINAEDYAFLRGSGIGQPTGIIGHASAYEVPRAGAGAISTADVFEMYSHALFGGPLVWIGSQSILPSLLTLTDDGNRHIWQPNAREGAPGTLMGIPLILNHRSPLLGDDGDLVLADLRYYLIKDGSGPFLSASEHVFFRSNKTVIKVFWNVDGKPWMTDTLSLETDGGATPTFFEVSPFVVLGPASG